MLLILLLYCTALLIYRHVIFKIGYKESQIIVSGIYIVVFGIFIILTVNFVKKNVRERLSIIIKAAVLVYLMTNSFTINKIRI